MPGPDGDRDGSTFEHAYDFDRLNRQMRAVGEFMADGRWHLLHAIAAGVGAPEASVSARLRDMRKAKYGGFQIDRRRDPDSKGLWWYRLNGHMPVLTLASEPKPAADAELQRRLDLVLAMCDAADEAHAGHLRVAQVRAAADGSLT